MIIHYFTCNNIIKSIDCTNQNFLPNEKNLIFAITDDQNNDINFDHIKDQLKMIEVNLIRGYSYPIELIQASLNACDRYIQITQEQETIQQDIFVFNPFEDQTKTTPKTGNYRLKNMLDQTISEATTDQNDQLTFDLTGVDNEMELELYFVSLSEELQQIEDTVRAGSLTSFNKNILQAINPINTYPQ